MDWVPAVLIAACGIGLLGVAVGPVAGDEVTADRTLNATEVSPGETVQVTGTVTVESASDITYADEFDPEFASGALRAIEVDGESVEPFLSADAGSDVLVGLEDVGPGAVTVTYDVTVPQDAPAGAYTFDGTVQVGDETVDIGGEDTLTVEGTNGDDPGNGENGDGENGDDPDNGENGDDTNGDDDGFGPGFGVVVVALGILSVAVVLSRRGSA